MQDIYQSCKSQARGQAQPGLPQPASAQREQNQGESTMRQSLDGQDSSLLEAADWQKGDAHLSCELPLGVLRSPQVLDKLLVLHCAL